MRRSVAEGVVPVGWPPVSEVLGQVAKRGIPIFACGTCARARSPKIFVSLVEWADRIIGVTEADLANWGAQFGSQSRRLRGASSRAPTC